MNMMKERNLHSQMTQKSVLLKTCDSFYMVQIRKENNAGVQAEHP